MDSPWPKPPGGGQSILLSPFSHLAISCPAPAPGKLHLLLLNHFLFTACLLQPLSSSNTQQPSKSSPDGCLDRRGPDHCSQGGAPDPSFQAPDQPQGWGAWALEEGKDTSGAQG